MAEINLKKLAEERDAQHEEHVRSRMAELGPMEAGMEESYRQAKIGAYVAVAGLVGGLGIMYCSQIYEAVKNLF